MLLRWPILTEICRGFPESLRANSQIDPKLGLDDLLPYPLQYVSNFVIRLYSIECILLLV